MDYDDEGVEASNKYDREVNKVIRKAEAIYDKQIDISDEVGKAFGLCKTCKQFAFAEGEFSIVFAKCEWFQAPMTHKNPIHNCSHYEDRNSLTLFEMKQIAVPIDVPKPKMGFARKEECYEEKKQDGESGSKDAPAQG